MSINRYIAYKKSMGFIRKLIPTGRWKFPVIIILAVFTGLALYSFYISNAPSYLGDKPKTCVNCHIMAPQYVTWYHSSHREKTNCNDCHVPHNNILNKYYFKAKDGLRHATIFTLRKEPQVIFIKDEGKEVVHTNCIRCHTELLTDSRLLAYTRKTHEFRMNRKCWECHRETPHGRVNSLSSVPYARVPLPGSVVPLWLKNITDKNK
jgi:cytochrome c nitrite reductase small subunit